MISKYILSFSYEKPSDSEVEGLSKIITRIYTDVSLDNLLAKAMKLQQAHASAYEYLYSSALLIFAIMENEGAYDMPIRPEYSACVNGVSIDNQYACRTANVNKIDSIRKLLEKRGVIENA